MRKRKKTECLIAQKRHKIVLRLYFSNRVMVFWITRGCTFRATQISMAQKISDRGWWYRNANQTPEHSIVHILRKYGARGVDAFISITTRNKHSVIRQSGKYVKNSKVLRIFKIEILRRKVAHTVAIWCIFALLTDGPQKQLNSRVFEKSLRFLKEERVKIRNIYIGGKRIQDIAPERRALCLDQKNCAEPQTWRDEDGWWSSVQVEGLPVDTPDKLWLDPKSQDRQPC